jgi:iron complex outermembrane receptor protein
VIRYEFSDRANIYASITKGFKSGVFNAVSAAGALTPARPEKVTAYEIGLKSKPLGGVTFNAAAFHYKYTDLQVTLIIPGSGGGGGAPLTALDNAPLAKINGFELDAAANLAKGFRVTAGISILDPEVKKFPNAAIPVPQFFNGLPNGNVTTTTPIDVSGNDLIRAPRFTANLGLIYERPLAGGMLTLAGNAYFSGKYYTDLLNREAIAQKRYEVINASASWTSPDEHWKVTVFGKNLTNSYYQTAILVSNGADNAAYAKPRWFGATLEYNF